MMHHFKFLQNGRPAEFVLFSLDSACDHKSPASWLSIGFSLGPDQHA